MKQEPIKSFRGKYYFLSNFFPVEIYKGGIVYPSLEHAFQAMKTLNTEDRLVIADAATPGKAKHLGRNVDLRPDWDRMRLGVMYRLLKLKFKLPTLSKKLLATEDRELIEGNDWFDFYWGVCNGRGENHLGKLLMRVRQEAKEGK